MADPTGVEEGDLAIGNGIASAATVKVTEMDELNLAHDTQAPFLTASSKQITINGLDVKVWTMNLS